MADSPSKICRSRPSIILCYGGLMSVQKDIDKVFDLDKLKKTQKEPDNIKSKLYNIWKVEVTLFKLVNQKKICPALLLLKKQKTYIDTPSVSLQ